MIPATHDGVERRFVIRPRTSALVGGVLVMGGAAIFAGWMAVNDDRGLIIDGAIELGPRGASILYVVLAMMTGLFLVAAIAQAVRTRGGRLAVVVDDRAITVPGHLFRPAPRMIGFGEIRQVTVQHVSGHDLIEIRSAAGNVTIAKAGVGPAAFDELLTILADRVRPAAPLPTARVQKSVSPIAK
jgi:hypothetical protein